MNPDRYAIEDRIPEGSVENREHSHNGHRDHAVNVDTVDPVCGMTVDPQHAGAQVTHLGRTVSFCCSGCADAFRSNPDAYLLGDGSA